ncbi:hypothetical protein imdm_1316 [gamma proteobacterium IMCC2047]|nr:hypothetical protein imdm_1316 [gamma proteobacterium IMCC2047]
MGVLGVIERHFLSVKRSMCAAQIICELSKLALIDGLLMRCRCLYNAARY